jgi:ABC-type branched-subunit amino acid transport system ATPase component/ABC-type branched-subunit amino acid transport system permease subunit
MRLRSARGGLTAVSWVAATALLTALPWLGVNGYWIRQLSLIGMLSLIVSGLNISFGFAGELALGQAAAYAAGAYAGAYVAVHVVNDVLVALLAGAVAAVAAGLVSGGPGLRIGGWVLAISSFFLVLLIPDIINLLPHSALGGYDGLTGIPLPNLLGHQLSTNAYYALLVVVTGVWFALFRNLLVSRFGAALLVLKNSPALARSLGISPYRLKLHAYILGAVPAGLAGALFAYLEGYISPDSFTLDLSIAVLAASILGGMTSIYGALIGATLLQLGPLRSAGLQQYALIGYGGFLVIGGLFFGAGIAGLATRLAGVVHSILRSRSSTAEVTPKRGEPERNVSFPKLPGQRLVVSSLSKRFGGATAVDDVSFIAEPGRVTALIGPNGSGKTTVLNLISGLYTVDAGTITLGAENLTSQSAHCTARLGVARTFQTPAIPEGLNVEQVAASSRFALERVSVLELMLRLPRYRRAARNDKALALHGLRVVAIDDVARDKGSALSLDRRRLLELARALAARPAVVLLDEVASGLDPAEVDRLGEVISGLRDAGATVVLVEHNFALVRSLADVIVVLADGRVVASGAPDDIAANPEVIARYLGEGHAEYLPPLDSEGPPVGQAR